ncbi:MAG: phenylalanine--tRNA ligase beta subunit-related protein [Eubacteriales bacterium]
MKFVIEESFFNLFPNSKIGIVTATGINNVYKPGQIETYEKLLRESETMALKYIKNEDFPSNYIISAWRDAYKLFPIKKGARCSVEAMIKRIKNGGQISLINPLVDIYNSISLRYGIPCGGEDIDCFSGLLRLTRAEGDEEFVSLDGGNNDSAMKGEVVYKDDVGVVCRCWNWREAKRTILREETKRAFLCLEWMDDTRTTDILSAMQELASIVENWIGGEVNFKLLDRSEPSYYLKD